MQCPAVKSNNNNSMTGNKKRTSPSRLVCWTLLVVASGVLASSSSSSPEESDKYRRSGKLEPMEEGEYRHFFRDRKLEEAYNDYDDNYGNNNGGGDNYNNGGGGGGDNYNNGGGYDSYAANGGYGNGGGGGGDYDNYGGGGGGGGYDNYAYDASRGDGYGGYGDSYGGGDDDGDGYSNQYANSKNFRASEYNKQLPYGQNFFADTQSTYYDGYQQAWRYLGHLVKCGAPSNRYDEEDDKSQHSGDGDDQRYRGNNWCQRYLVWAAVSSLFFLPRCIDRWGRKAPL